MNNSLGEKHVNASYHRQHRLQQSSHRARRSADIPLKFDWRDKGVVTPVRGQGSCGACWAFSTIEVAESMLAIKNGTLYTLSVQEVSHRSFTITFDTISFIYIYIYVYVRKTVYLICKKYGKEEIVSIDDRLCEKW